MQPLDTQLAYFKKNQVELSEKHHDKFVLIHGESVVGFYETELGAYTAAKRNYDGGTFLIRRCLKPEEEAVHVFHSRVAI